MSLGVFGVVRAIIRFTLIMVNNLTAIPAYLLTMIMLRPLLWCGGMCDRFYWRVEGVLFRLLFMQVDYWQWSAGYTVVEVGDDISLCIEEPTLIVCNHQSTGDVPTLMSTFVHHGSWADKVYWIMDILFKYTQFGLVSQMHGDYFIQQGRATRNSQLSTLRAHLDRVYSSRGRKCVVLFPEGGFLRKRRATSKEYARKHGFPVLENVTLPRIGAMRTILQTLCKDSDTCSKKRDRVSSYNYSDNGTSPITSSSNGIKDVTIAYPEGRPLDLFSGIFGHRPPCTTYVHYRKYPASSVPKDEQGLQQWIYQRYVEKEKILDDYYSTGQMSGAEAGRRLHTNSLLMWCTHLMWFTLFVVYFYILRSCFSFLFLSVYHFIY